MRCILLLLGIVTLAGCDNALMRVPPPPIGAHLTGTEIKAELIGSSLVTVEEQVPPLSLFFSESGEMFGIRSNNYRDTGTWEIKDDTVCGKWQNWYGTMSSCWQVFRNGERITIKSTVDERVATAILTPGDAVGS